MSRPMNMLRTRRKDCNVKPNRRLDRKSSRGMLYENEELRLKTININAEVESRQSDIKKLKRENEMLKKGLWYLRDEYDKLERLIKDKKLDFYSSSSTTCSSSSSEEESGSSCGEEGEEVETTQNIKNVQRTNLRNMKDQFDHLSVVTEETSAENSEHNSNRTSVPNENWNTYDNDVIRPDQSYPACRAMGKSQTLPQERAPYNFFSPIQTSKSYDDNQFNQVRDAALEAAPYFANSTGHHAHFQNDQGAGFSDVPSYQQFQPNCDTFLSQKIVQTNASSFYQNMVLVPKSTKPQPETTSMEKASTDLIVKIDNQNFNNNALVFSNTPSQSTFSNGGNLEELLNDIESISQRGNNQNPQGDDAALQDDARRFILEVQTDNQPYLQSTAILDNPVPENSQHLPITPEKPYKSELNVVLMPNPMPLIGFDKYKNIQRSLESLNAKPLDEVTASQQNLRLIPPPPLPAAPSLGVCTPNLPLPPPPPIFLEEGDMRRTCEETETNPFFFGNLKDNYVNADYFNMRYNPDNFAVNEAVQEKKIKAYDPKSGSKTNLLDLTSSEHVSSENEENLKFKTSKPDKTEDKKPDQHQQEAKAPKLSIRRKVSIHFKGKKEKAKKVNVEGAPETPKPRTPGEKKGSIFDIRFSDKDKEKDKDKRISYQKTSSIESRMSTTETSNAEPKTPTSSDSKTSNERRNLRREDSTGEKKTRHSVSVSPDRTRHVHLKEEGGKKHKKHKRTDRNRGRRPSGMADSRNYRERSFSVCTDRSNILEHRLGLGLGLGSSYLYDEYSDRERTNSLSSCETNENARKLSTMSNVPLSGKVPWCGCWGNGCL